MIEKVLLDYLNKHMAVPCYLERPIKCPKSYVLLEKTSGSIENHIRYCTFAIQSYAETLFKCVQLNEQVIENMLNATLLDEILSVDLNSDYNFTDPSTKEYRYQAVFDLVY